MFVLSNVRHADFPEEPDCRAQAHNLAGHLGAGLKTLRWGRKGAFVHCHDFDHGAAGQKRGQLRQPLRLAVECPNPGGSAHFMAGECREIHIQGVEIHRHVRHGLAGVQHHQGAYRAGPRHQG